MIGTLIDIATAAYTGTGAWQGRKHKLYTDSFIGKAVGSFILSTDEEQP